MTCKPKTKSAHTFYLYDEVVMQMDRLLESGMPAPGFKKSHYINLAIARLNEQLLHNEMPEIPKEAPKSNEVLINGKKYMIKQQK